MICCHLSSTSEGYRFVQSHLEQRHTIMLAPPNQYQRNGNIVVKAVNLKKEGETCLEFQTSEKSRWDVQNRMNLTVVKTRKRSVYSFHGLNGLDHDVIF